MPLSRDTPMRTLIGLFVAALIAYAPIQGFARGGGHSSSGSGQLSGSGYVNPSSHYTHGYYRHDGTYVHGYHATNPNSTGTDNYSTRGNVNPWTGQPGSHYVDH
jgi:hypothetical protein